MHGKEALNLKEGAGGWEGKKSTTGKKKKQKQEKTNKPVWSWINIYPALIILWKTLHFGHISAHMYKVCVCAYTHGKHKLSWRVNIRESLLYRLQQRYLFRIALWYTIHRCVCVRFTTTAWINSGQRQFMWMKKFHL